MSKKLMYLSKFQDSTPQNQKAENDTSGTKKTNDEEKAAADNAFQDEEILAEQALSAEQSKNILETF